MAGIAVEDTKRILFERIGILQGRFLDKSVNRMDQRLQAPPGPHKAAKDPHAEGRALDIILFATEPSELTIANRLVQAFLSVRVEMGWSTVIYNKRQWNVSGVESPRLAAKGDKNAASFEHITHIHIEWRAADVNRSGVMFEPDLITAIRREVDGLPLAGQAFYFYFGDADPKKAREQQAAYVAKIKAKGGEVTDVMSIWVNFVVQMGKEVKLKGDPLDTDLETAQRLGVKIIGTDKLDAML